jgi:DHA1 family bicyclomycin/chloramphenicol resistance-like MFS transporter
MSLLMLVVSTSPLLAPLTGSFIIGGFGWRGVFWALTAAGVIAFLLAATQLQETREIHHRADSSWASAFEAYRKLLTDPTFLGLTLVGTFGVSSFFIYLASASFVITNHYGLTPTMFSLCFALNAAALFGFGQLTARMTAKYGLTRVIRVTVSGFAIAMSIVAVLFMTGADSLALMMIFLFVGYGFLGPVLTTTAVLSLEDHGAIAGTASALIGALQFGVGAAVMAVSGVFADGAPKPMLIGIALSALIAFAIAQFTLRAENSRLPAEADCPG